jgi:hypothetical protein
MLTRLTLCRSPILLHSVAQYADNRVQQEIIVVQQGATLLHTDATADNSMGHWCEQQQATAAT